MARVERAMPRSPLAAALMPFLPFLDDYLAACADERRALLVDHDATRDPRSFTAEADGERAGDVAGAARALLAR